MAELVADPPAAGPSVPPQEMREHRRSYVSFERMVLFSVLHVALVLVCLALAFISHVPLIAFLLFVVGSLTIIASFVVYNTSHEV